ncbi:MAG: helix-hairpin-helix domain-containing protein, partial [Haliscomenobacter sp.]
PFAEGSRAQNENGWYIGAELHPSGRWHLAAFADRWIHPWPRYQVDGTGRGKEYRLRADYVIRKRLNTYLEWRLKQTEENLSGEAGFRALAWTGRWQLRMHAGVSGPNSWEWRSRLDLGGYQSPGGEREYGWVFLQDMLYRPIARPLSATARISIFRTDSWNVRFYEYENDLLDIFVLSPYYQTGMRYYLNLRIRPLPGLTMECRFSQTRWWRPEQIGSGLDAFPGGVKSQISSQLKLVF